MNKCWNVKCTADGSINITRQKLLYYPVNTIRHLINTKYTRIDYSRKSKTRILQLAWIKFGGTFSILYISNQQKWALPRNPVRFCAFISGIHLNMSKTLAKKEEIKLWGENTLVITVLIHGETAPPRGTRLQRQQDFALQTIQACSSPLQICKNSNAPSTSSAAMRNKDSVKLMSTFFFSRIFMIISWVNPGFSFSAWHGQTNNTNQSKTTRNKSFLIFKKLNILSANLWRKT